MKPIKLLRTSLLTLGLLGILHSNIQAGEIEQTAFVERFYQNIMGRTADSGGMNTWLNVIQTQSATKVALGFFKSQEFINKNLPNEQFVDILYQTLFDRQGDTDGRNGWINQLNSGTSKDEVMYGFFNAQEFKNLADRFGVTQIRPEDQLNAGSTGVDGYVNRFYTLVLNRNADTSGFNDWTTQLNTGTKAGGDIAKGFFNSQEYLNRGLDNNTFLDICYRAFFDREADEGGKNDWLNRIATQGYTKDQILDGFIDSQEFINLANNYGIANRLNDREINFILLPSSNIISQNEIYRDIYRGGTQLKRLKIENSAGKECTVDIKDTTNVYNPYSNAYIINGNDTLSSSYNLGSSNVDMEFTIGWMYYTTIDSNIDFSVSCVLSNIPVETPTEILLPTFQREITRQGYTNLIFSRDEGYVENAVSFYLNTYIATNSNWIEYKISALNFVNNSANERDKIILLSDVGYLNNGVKVPRKIVCSYTYTKIESPKEYDVLCSAFDADQNVIISKQTHLIGDNINISFDSRFLTRDNYYLVNTPANGSTTLP